MKACITCSLHKRCTSVSRDVVCNCYKKYERKKEDEIMNTDNVLVLHYPEPNGNDLLLRGVCKMIDKIEIKNFIKKDSKLKIKNILKGKIKMIYSLKGKPNLVHNDSGEIFSGSIIFVSFNENNEPINLKDNQIKAIKSVYRKVEAGV